MRIRAVALAGPVLLLAGLAPALAARRPWTPADTQRVVAVGDVRISPDGDRIVFEVRRSDLAKNAEFSSVSLVPASGGAVRAITEGEVHDSSPRWSPDGKRIAFLSKVDKHSELAIVDADGTGRRRVCDVVESNERLQETGDVFAWSPDGKWFVFAGADPKEKPLERDPLVITRLMFKANTDYTDNRRTQIWVVSAAGGEPRRLSDGRFVDHSPAWSPDGRSIAFISDRGADPDFHLENDVFVADVATGAVRRLTDSRGSEFYPAWSPDGKSVAYLATKRDWTTRDSIAEDFHVWVIPAAGGNPRELGAALDRRVESVAWSPDSSSLLFTAQDRGRVLPYRVSSDGGPTRLLFDRDVSIGEPSLAGRSGRIAFAITSPTAPPEVAVLDPPDAAPRVLTHLNDSLLQELPVEAAETVRFTSTGGTRVEGWLLKPMGMEASRRYPLVLFVHGGPHGQFGYRFSPEYQMYASRGYAVLYMNPRGSTGYGQAFSDACLGNWGGVDYEDLMTGIDEVVRTRSFVDPNRMVVTGGSYGGFMTNWIVTHTARFRAAVTREGMSNLATDSALSDAWDLEYIEFGPPWEKYDTLMKWSPIRYITRARTPTLIIEGERDHDVTMAEAEQMYQGLKLQKVETELVVYPREGHGFHEPKHRADAYERMLRWFGDHLATSATVDQAWK